MSKKFGTFKNADGSQTTRRKIKSLKEAPPSLRDELRRQERELEGGGKCGCISWIFVFIIMAFLIKGCAG